MRKKIFTLLAAASVLMPLSSSAQGYKLWYRQPARVWTQALPLGNGRLGAMVFGQPATERIQLNEETIWAGQPNNNYNPEAREWIPRIREMIFEGRYADAEAAANDHVMSAKNHGMPYETFGDVFISTPGTAGYTDYYRELSLDSARTLTTYRVGGVSYRREAIASLEDNVIAIHFTASRPGSITFNANFSSPHNDPIILSDNGEVTLTAVTQNHEGLKGKVRFQGRMTARAVGGSCESKDGIISVAGADEATLYITIATNFNNYKDITADEAARTRAAIDAAVSHDYGWQKARHYEKYHEQISRCTLSLGPDRFASMPTDERLANFAANDDNWLVATYFTFGRYLLIASSQPGTQPANLQGIWNDKLLPSWDSKYTTNINLEMNYWPSETTNLTDLNAPLFRLIDEVSQTGSETASRMYGVGGWVLHHNTDIWRITGAVDHAPSGMWMTGGAWLSQHLWQHYLFTGDREFLRRAYPVMKGAAAFLDSMLVRDPQSGAMVICPAVSPENVHPDGHGKKKSQSSGTTMDNELLCELFNNVITASAVLGNADRSLADHYRQRLKELAPLRIGSWGQLQEWQQDWDDPDDNHRHVSHLYALYPSSQISPRRTPELADAARTSLVHRGDPSTGWSMGWKVCLWARLLDGDHAYRIIENQLTRADDSFVAYGTTKKKGGTYDNLFDAHPPFQIDGNFGCTAGIAEMLVQSSDGFVDLLPALPSVWRAEGEVRGIRTRGGFVIDDMAWRDGRLTRLVITSTLGGNLNLRSAQRLPRLRRMKPADANVLLATPATPACVNDSKKALNAFDLPKVYEYNIPTRRGERIVVL